jgi:hypothetical protein
MHLRSKKDKGKAMQGVTDNPNPKPSNIFRRVVAVVNERRDMSRLYIVCI